MKMFFKSIKIFFALFVVVVTFTFFYHISSNQDAKNENHFSQNEKKFHHYKQQIPNQNINRAISSEENTPKAYIKVNETHEVVTVIPKGKRLYDEEAMKLIASDVNGDSYSDDFHTDENHQSR